MAAQSFNFQICIIFGRLHGLKRGLHFSFICFLIINPYRLSYVLLRLLSISVGEGGIVFIFYSQKSSDKLFLDTTWNPVHRIGNLNIDWRVLFLSEHGLCERILNLKVVRPEFFIS